MHYDDDDDGDSTEGKCVYLYRMKEGMSAHDWSDIAMWLIIVIVDVVFVVLWRWVCV